MLFHHYGASLTVKGAYSDYTAIFSSLSNSSFFQYCDSNIGLFSLASYIVLALKGDSEE